MTDSYLYWIVALLPLAAGMVVLQDDPYHALVMRGILGAIAAMVYAVLGAADVALTEALVGTMLAITLYAIAVRSSLVLQLGVLESKTDCPPDAAFTQLTNELQRILHKRHLRLEILPFANSQALQRALFDREVHAICDGRSLLDSQLDSPQLPYHIALRVPRLYEILQAELPEGAVTLSQVNVADGLPVLTADETSPDLEEVY